MAAGQAGFRAGHIWKCGTFVTVLGPSQTCVYVMLKHWLPEAPPKTRAFKCTVLSWLAKWGAKKTDRKLLGHHLDQSDFSVTTYSRDALAQPLRTMVTVLQDIKSGCSHPVSPKQAISRSASLKRRSWPHRPFEPESSVEEHQLFSPSGQV